MRLSAHYTQAQRHVAKTGYLCQIVKPVKVVFAPCMVLFRNSEIPQRKHMAAPCALEFFPVATAKGTVHADIRRTEGAFELIESDRLHEG